MTAEQERRIREEIRNAGRHASVVACSLAATVLAAVGASAWIIAGVLTLALFWLALPAITRPSTGTARGTPTAPATRCAPAPNPEEWELTPKENP